MSEAGPAQGGVVGPGAPARRWLRDVFSVVSQPVLLVGVIESRSAL